jgi:hypothetical protein
MVVSTGFERAHIRSHTGGVSDAHRWNANAAY